MPKIPSKFPQHAPNLEGKREDANLQKTQLENTKGRNTTISQKGVEWYLDNKGGVVQLLCLGYLQFVH